MPPSLQRVMEREEKETQPTSHAAAEPPASLPRDGGFGRPRHLTPQDSCHPVSNRAVHWMLREGRSNICGEELTVSCGTASEKPAWEYAQIWQDQSDARVLCQKQ